VNINALADISMTVLWVSSFHTVYHINMYAALDSSGRRAVPPQPDAERDKTSQKARANYGGGVAS